MKYFGRLFIGILVLIISFIVSSVMEFLNRYIGWSDTFKTIVSIQVFALLSYLIGCLAQDLVNTFNPKNKIKEKGVER